MVETTLGLVRQPVARRAVDAFALEHGLKLAADPPWTGGIRQSTWTGDDTQLTFATHAPSGYGLFVIAAPDGALVKALGKRFELESAEAVMATAEKAQGTEARVRGLFAVGALLLSNHRDPDAEVRLLCRRLADPDKWVRFTAARILRGWPRRDVVEAMAHAGDVYPEIRPLAAHLKRQWEAAEAGILDDHPTDDWAELIRRARAGLAEGKLARVERATAMLLDDRLDHGEGLLLRAKFHASVGQPMVALGLARAAREVFAREADERDEGDTDDLVELVGEVEAFRVSLDGAPPEQGAREAVLGWLERFRDDERVDPLCGMAEGLHEEMPSLRSLLLFMVGRHRGDVEPLTEAVRLVPDAPSLRLAHGRALLEVNSARAEVELREALRLAETGAQSEAAAQIEAFGDELDRASTLETLTAMLYEQERYEEAGKLADALVAEDPESALGWQVRANARTFTGRHAEAAQLYREALAGLEAILGGDGIMIGHDPRPAMHFNLACVLSKIDAREEALDALRLAVRADEQWANQAVVDDYFGALMDDEAFKRIVAQDPRALVLPEELTKEAVSELLERSLITSHGADVEGALEATAEVIQRAQWGGHEALLQRGLAIRGRLVALEGEPAAGLELTERALAMSPEGAHIRAEVTQAHGFVLQLNGRLDEAERAYLAALLEWRAFLGEGHPKVAKSLGHLANLAAARGRDEAAEQLHREAAELLEAHLEMADPTEPAEEDVEAWVDLSSLRANLAHRAMRGASWPEALAEIVAAVEAIDHLMGLGYRPAAAVLEHLSTLTAELATAADDDVAPAAEAVRSRLETIGLDPRPAVRQEQLFWRRLRRFANRMRDEGASDEIIAETFAHALHGAAQLPEALRAVPELAEFAHALARRTAAVPTFLVLAPMALQTAQADGDFDGALEQLEGLCLSYAVEGDQLQVPE